MSQSPARVEHNSYAITVFSWLGLVSVTAFGLIHVFTGEDIFLGYLEVAAGFVLLLNLFFLKISRRVELAGAFFLLTLFVILLVMIVTGGIQLTGIFWFFAFPSASFFLAGKKKGPVWIGALVAMVLTVFVLSVFGITTVAYSWVTVRQMLIILGVVSLATYLYQNSVEKYESQVATDQLALQVEKEKLAAEKVKDEAILESIGEGVVVVDNQGQIILLNQAAEEMLGKSLEELAGKRYVDAVPMFDDAGQEVAESDRPIKTSLLEGKKIQLTSNYVHQNGEHFPVNIISTPFIVEGKIIGAIFTFRDITEDRKVDRAKSEFVTLASHQLRTPITAISWYVEMLLQGDFGQLNEDQKGHLEKIQQSNTRMVNMINQLLTVSRIEMGNFKVEVQPTNLSQLCQTVVDEVLRLFKDKNLQVKTNLATNVPNIPVDPYIAKLIIQNIFENACKYTPEQGSITMNLIVNAATPEVPGDITISIADTGYGIPKFQQKDIFTKLFRADNIREKDTDGTGLGLFIVKSTLDLVGGKIWFTSTEGQGSTFFISFPLTGMKQRQGAEQL